MPTNTAAWLVAKQAKLEVKPAPYMHPRENEIVVKNHAVAINPLDWINQIAGNIVSRWIKYPFVLGKDLAGEVVEVGNAITRFKVGDRVLGHAVGTDKNPNTSAESAFQIYTVLLAHMAAPIPSTCRTKAPLFSPWPSPPPLVACSRKIIWHYSIPLRPRNPLGRRFSSGEAQRALAAMPFSSPSLPDTRSSRPHHHEISTT